MYKVVLIDDEPWILDGINATFKWAENGFEVVHMTTNPLIGKKYIVDELPDVVFTDIRMPGINGLELIEQVVKKGSEAFFVIISGYSEFEYAKQAIKLQVHDYILKPLQQRQLFESKIDTYLLHKRILRF